MTDAKGITAMPGGFDEAPSQNMGIPQGGKMQS